MPWNLWSGGETVNEAEKISEEVIAENFPQTVKDINQYLRSSMNPKPDKYKENHVCG